MPELLLCPHHVNSKKDRVIAIFKSLFHVSVKFPVDHGVNPAEKLGLHLYLPKEAIMLIM